MLSRFSRVRLYATLWTAAVLYMSSHNSVCYNQRCNIYEGFPDTSVVKESSCNAGDLGSIPGSERPAGEGIGYSLQYSWVSLMAQLVKNLPAVGEAWIQSLG